MKHIILIGFMGAGKTTVGKKLAKKLGVKFVDTDHLIEVRTGKKISDIFQEQGEAYFRSLETQALRDLSKETEQMVVAVGGGLPMQPENRPLLKELGTVIFLEAGVDALMRRLKNDTVRPKLQGGDLRERISTLMAERKETYLQVADLRISTENKGFHGILKEIEEKIVEKF